MNFETAFYAIGWALFCAAGLLVVVRALRDRRKATRPAAPVERTELEVRANGEMKATVTRPKDESPRCQICGSQVRATHPMPIVVDESEVDDSVVADLKRAFGVKRQRTGKRVVINDADQPESLCAMHHREAFNLRQAQISEEEAALAHARANASKAIAVAEGGGIVALARRLDQVIKEDAEFDAEQHRRHPKQLKAKDEDRTN